MATWLERYHSGEHKGVWAEMVAAGDRILHEPLRTEALAVARETMERAGYNIVQLRRRLEQIGYRFAYPDEVLIGPTPNISRQIDELERRVGPIPFAVRAWYEIVGSVNFIGEHPNWTPDGHADPLVVDPFELAIEHYREWREDVREYGRTEMGPYQLPIAPDSYHKADIVHMPQRTISIYQIVLPSPTADAVLGEEPHHTTFVDYLRTCFRWGGFPGFERSPAQPKELALLTHGLLRL